MTTDQRPANCRNRLKNEGKPYPRSGCSHCKTGGLFGCPFEKKGQEPSSPQKLTAVPVPYSSIVGGSIMLNDANGKCVAMLAIMQGNPDPRTHKEFTTQISEYVVNAINRSDI